MIARARFPIAVMILLLAGCDAGRPTHFAVGRAITSLPVVSFANPPSPTPSLEGHVTLLNFWGTWCPPCRRELPGLVRLANRLSEEPRFQLVAVSCGYGSDDADLPRETTRFLAERQMAVAAWGFSDGLSARLFAEAYGLEAFPTTYLIGPDARIRRVWTGYRSSDEADMAAAILNLLAASTNREVTSETSP